MRQFILLALIAATPVLAAGDVLPPTPEQQLSAARSEVARAITRRRAPKLLFQFSAGPAGEGQ